MNYNDRSLSPSPFLSQGNDVMIHIYKCDNDNINHNSGDGSIEDDNSNDDKYNQPNDKDYNHHDSYNYNMMTTGTTAIIKNNTVNNDYIDNTDTVPIQLLYYE